MALNVWTKPSGYSFGIFPEQESIDEQLPIQSDTGVTYSIISGGLPSGVFLVGNRLIGSPYVTNNVLTYAFCIRASRGFDLSDRTYQLSVTGIDAPVFITPEGGLPAGLYHQFYVLDGSYVDYQLQAIDLNAEAGQVLTFLIEDGNGELPPGLTMTRSGLIIGFITPILSQLNRDDLYQFIVTISDGILSAQRLFRIFVVAPDQFRADSLTLSGVAGQFTADSTYVTNPVWRTPTDLGTYRANNYITIPVGLYDNNNTTFRVEVTNTEVYAVTLQVGLSNLSGTNELTVTNVSSIPLVGYYFTFENYIVGAPDTVYIINSVTSIGDGVYGLTLNANLASTLDNGTAFYMGTLSKFPSGLNFDESTSELYGLIPYQPAVTKTFMFTITASRFVLGSTDSISTSRTFTMRLIGDITSAISWITDRDLNTLNANYISTLQVSASSNIANVKIDYSLTSGRLPPGITLSQGGELIGSVNQYFRPETNELGLITFDTFTDNLLGELLLNDPRSTRSDAATTFDQGTTTYDRTYVFEVTAGDQYGYSASAREFLLTIDTPNTVEYTDFAVSPFLESGQRGAWRAFISNTNIFVPDNIYRANDINFGLRQDLNMLVFAGIQLQSASTYSTAMANGFKRKRFVFESIQTAIANDPITNAPVYEIIYAKMHDSLELNGGKLPANITLNNTVYYPNSITNWRNAIRATGISERNYLPLWMRTIQPGTKEQLGYTMAIPLCYCKVGLAADIVANIKFSEFDFKTLDYTVDRFTVHMVTGDKYLAFKNDRTTV